MCQPDLALQTKNAAMCTEYFVSYRERLFGYFTSTILAEKVQSLYIHVLIKRFAHETIEVENSLADLWIGNLFNLDILLSRQRLNLDYQDRIDMAWMPVLMFW